MTEEENDDLSNTCWICFGAGTSEEPLLRACRCPTLVHGRCLARWQLHCAGRAEERLCRFCAQSYPDWRPVLTPPDAKCIGPPPAPVLSIYYNGQCTRMKVRPGPDGLTAFVNQLEAILGRDINSVNLVFRCRCPDTGNELYLNGLQAWSAAIHCACVRAVRRMASSQVRSRGTSSSRHAAAAAAGTGQAQTPHASQVNPSSVRGNALAQAAPALLRTAAPAQAPPQPEATAAWPPIPHARNNPYHAGAPQQQQHAVQRPAHASARRERSLATLSAPASLPATPADAWHTHAARALMAQQLVLRHAQASASTSSASSDLASADSLHAAPSSAAAGAACRPGGQGDVPPAATAAPDSPAAAAAAVGCDPQQQPEMQVIRQAAQPTAHRGQAEGVRRPAAAQDFMLSNPARNGHHQTASTTAAAQQASVAAAASHGGLLYDHQQATHIAAAAAQRILQQHQQQHYAAQAGLASAGPSAAAAAPPERRRVQRLHQQLALHEHQHHQRQLLEGSPGEGPSSSSGDGTGRLLRLLDAQLPPVNQGDASGSIPGGASGAPGMGGHQAGQAGCQGQYCSQVVCTAAADKARAQCAAAVARGVAAGGCTAGDAGSNGVPAALAHVHSSLIDSMTMSSMSLGLGTLDSQATSSSAAPHHQHHNHQVPQSATYSHAVMCCNSSQLGLRTDTISGPQGFHVLDSAAAAGAMIAAAAAGASGVAAASGPAPRVEHSFGGGRDCGALLLQPCTGAPLSEPPPVRLDTSSSCMSSRGPVRRTHGVAGLDCGASPGREDSVTSGRAGPSSSGSSSSSRACKRGGAGCVHGCGSAPATDAGGLERKGSSGSTPAAILGRMRSLLRSLALGPSGTA